MDRDDKKLSEFRRPFPCLGSTEKKVDAPAPREREKYTAEEVRSKEPDRAIIKE